MTTKPYSYISKNWFQILDNYTYYGRFSILSYLNWGFLIVQSKALLKLKTQLPY